MAQARALVGRTVIRDSMVMCATAVVKEQFEQAGLPVPLRAI